MQQLQKNSELKHKRYASQSNHSAMQGLNQFKIDNDTSREDHQVAKSRAARNSVVLPMKRNVKPSNLSMFSPAVRQEDADSSFDQRGPVMQLRRNQVDFTSELAEDIYNSPQVQQMSATKGPGQQQFFTSRARKYKNPIAQKF